MESKLKENIKKLNKLSSRVDLDIGNFQLNMMNLSEGYTFKQAVEELNDLAGETWEIVICENKVSVTWLWDCDLDNIHPDNAPGLTFTTFPVFLPWVAQTLLKLPEAPKWKRVNPNNLDYEFYLA